MPNDCNLTPNETPSLYVGTILVSGDPVEMRAFPTLKDAKLWVETHVRSPCEWGGSKSSSSQVVLGTEESRFPDTPGRVDRVPVSSIDRVVQKWGFD